MLLPSFEKLPPLPHLSQGHFSVIPSFHEKRSGERKEAIISLI